MLESDPFTDGVVCLSELNAATRIPVFYTLSFPLLVVPAWKLGAQVLTLEVARCQALAVG
jgi:hypothetical protein